MKRLLLIAFLVILALVLTHRYRVFVRDPLATVYRSSDPSGKDAAKQTGTEVYINYANDVLLMRGGEQASSLLIQHWNLTPGYPTRLRCIHWMACLTDADQAATVPVHAATSHFDPSVQMTDRSVRFTEPDGATTRVDLR